MDECSDVEGEEHEVCGAVEKSILRVGIENGEYSGVLLWVPGWGWLGRVNLKLRKQPPTKRHL